MRGNDEIRGEASYPITIFKFNTSKNVHEVKKILKLIDTFVFLK